MFSNMKCFFFFFFVEILWFLLAVVCLIHLISYRKECRIPWISIFQNIEMTDCNEVQKGNETESENETENVCQNLSDEVP